MNFGRLKSLVEAEFSNEKLVIVTNREPYVHKRTQEGLKVERPAGGVTSAMDDVLRVTGGKWVAWGSGSGDKDVVDDMARVAVPPDKPSYTLKRVWLNSTVMENYYHGYSNRVLWPLCHITLDRVYFLQKFWTYYKKANESFAKAVIEEADDDSVVWVHDYQLCLVPQIVRAARPALTLVHFWHIPWPDWSVFRVCPQAKELLEALLCNDLIGFQIPLFVKNFMDCVRECLGLDAQIDYKAATVTHAGRTTALKAFPISIDYDRFNTTASTRRTVHAIRGIRGRHKLPGLVGVGVDRLEYTKGLIKRLQALELFFARYERFRNRFTFIQVAVPTRMKEPYLSYKRTVEALVARINARFSTESWKPIVYIDRNVNQADLAAYYRMADVVVISSVYDGMNLVAKEYAASQVDMNGALVLSEFAGSAEELEGAVPVNPYDIEGFARKIKDALTLPAREKALRMSGLRDQIRTHDIYRWITDILQAILTAASAKGEMGMYLYDNADEFKARLAGRGVMLFLDFDGTLAPIVDSPDKAALPESVRELVVRAKETMPVVIVSGRGMADVKARVGIDGLIYAGNHGAEIWNGHEMSGGEGLAHAGEPLKKIVSRLRLGLAHIDGALVEDKGITASIHYRMVRLKDMPEFFDIFGDIAKDCEGIFRIVSGRKVLEIRPLDAWDKGKAVAWIAENHGRGRTPVYIGDDTTDEDAFRAIKGTGVAVSIGGSAQADFYLRTQDEIAGFLEMVISAVGEARV